MLVLVNVNKKQFLLCLYRLCEYYGKVVIELQQNFVCRDYLNKLFSTDMFQLQKSLCRVSPHYHDEKCNSDAIMWFLQQTSTIISIS